MRVATSPPGTSWGNCRQRAAEWPKNTREAAGPTLGQTVEALGAPGQDLALRPLRQLRPAADQLRRAGEEAVGVRVVGGPEDLVRADVVGEHAETALHGLEGDPAVALEQLARPHREARVVEAAIVEV